MHTFSETGAGVPAFLAKLWRLVDDPDTNNLICWSKDGRSFIIQNQAQFARELLPLNYKHNNMASFIRQLNMYGFHKITSIDNGGLKFDRDEMEFSHPCFKRNCPYLLEHIKRKIANTKSIDDKTAVKPEAVSKVLQDVKAMRGRQDSLDSRFSVMKQENEALWREIASLRQKHAKQQQIVNKLIQFLITIVQPSRNMTSVKRHMQLMINDTPEYAKLRKTSESESDSGPVIHELGEELLDEVNDSDVELLDPTSPYVKLSAHAAHDTESPSPLNIERPHSSISMSSQNYDYSNQSAEDVLNAATAATAPGGNGLTSDAAAAASSIIQSVNSDGSQIVYHVTEVPDAHPRDAATPIPANYMEEENVLTTPMVRQEMARTQLLKQKSNNKRRRPAVATSPTMMDNVGAATSPKLQRISNQQQQQQKQQHQAPSTENIQIKSEQEIDPMIFLNVYPDNRVNTPNPSMMSPNLSEDSRQSGMNAGQAFTSITPTNMGQTPELYNPNDFIGSDMPADIFEDNSMLTGNNSNFSDNFKLNEQQQYGLSTATGGKFSSFIAGNNNNNNNNGNSSATTGASTSAAAAAAAAGPSSSSSALSASNNEASTSSPSTSNTANRSSTYTGGKNGTNMAVAKYKSAAALPHDENLRDDVHGHLDNMQDELESLKDLLRGDVYSLDANTLLGLFNDSDILGPYGLNLTADGPSDKKGGSELMSYQPIYDLSDIMDINNKNELDGATDSDSVAAPSSSRQLQSQSSVLNTPYHE